MRMPWYSGLLVLSVVAGFSSTAAALQVTVQDTVMDTIGPGDQCILLAGDYREVRIEPNEQGKRAKICFDNIRQNLIIITDSTFIATRPGGAEVEISFHHTFPPGPNRKVVAHTRMEGFFASATGLGVSTDAVVTVSGTFNQGGNSDPIGDGITHTVGEDVDSGIFKDEERERYLAAGERELTGKMVFALPEQGDKMVLHVGAQVDVQAVTRIQEKFEEAEEGLEEEFGEINELP